ncbi:SDR family NAD(P)-dependent oxidoreductase [Leptospira ellisii]|uniref:Oxidoreductase n=1 Tax=Leptospira ellisii TaxID=2023197 RepID=A0A2N0B3W7_9LEPT|nr:SDR family NAD(P)-dependent oxidoreductase [Leptospira ellisii]MDV6234726.1 SDR family NAD(P)-dependent oxidoreductase [Leptospira ellisii]PJZ91226.1 oxidoreductase [Leptospira ellisii]PKA05786.1 oxidoreductase [Leptospira ellisii]
MDIQLKGKNALVTGSTAGIGFAIAKQLLAEGANVYVNGRTKERVDEALGKLREIVPGSSPQGIVADFANAEDVSSVPKTLPETDILINNVGIFEPKPFETIPDEDWFRFFEINLMSGVRLSRSYLPKMLKKGWGRILFISSESGIQIPEEMIHYGVTKSAQISLARGLAELTKGTNVTVNSVLPGPTRSEGVDGFLDDLAKQRKVSVSTVEKEFFQNARPTSLLQRFAEVDEVANFVTYLSSPLASATNGAALRVDGGVVKSAF